MPSVRHERGSHARATFWLVDVPDSLADQSMHEPDGTGLDWFAAGPPRVDKQPLEAGRDKAFLREAREVVSRTFVAHVRWAYTGEVAERNTQPFDGDGTLFVHEGLVLDFDGIDERLGLDRALVGGESDSERIFALIRREARDATTGVGASPPPRHGWPTMCRCSASTSSSPPPPTSTPCATPTPSPHAHSGHQMDASLKTRIISNLQPPDASLPIGEGCV